MTKDGTTFASNTRPPECVWKVMPSGEVSKFLDGKPPALPNGVAIDTEGTSSS